MQGWTKRNPGEPRKHSSRGTLEFGKTGVKMYRTKSITDSRLSCFSMPRKTISFKKKTTRKTQQKSQCCMTLPSTSMCWLVLGLARDISSFSKVRMCHFLLTAASSTSPHCMARAEPCPWPLQSLAGAKRVQRPSLP